MNKQSDKMTAVEGARGIAAMAVLVAHAAMYAGNLVQAPLFSGFLQGGTVGVDFFFTLSGFVISYANFGRIGAPRELGHYFRRRWTRIYPIYWITFFLFLLTWATVSSFRQDWIFSVPQFLKDLFLFPQAGFPLVAVAWSLQFEEFFYILFASFIFKRAVGFAVFAAWIVAILAMNIGTPVDRSSFWQWFLFNGMNLQFVAGVALGFYVKNLKVPPNPTKIRVWAPTIAGIVAILLVLIARRNGGVDALNFIASEFSQRILAGGGAIAILWGVYPIRTLRGRISGGVFYLGRASYSVYIIHAFALELMSIAVGRFVTTIQGAYLYFAVTALLATAIGLLYFRYVEQPSTQIARNRFSEKSR